MVYNYNTEDYMYFFFYLMIYLFDLILGLLTCVS